MESLSEARYCAMRERCKWYDPKVGEPQKLSDRNKSKICERCQRAGYTLKDALPTGGTHVTTSDSSAGASELCSQCGEKRLAVTQLTIRLVSGEMENTPLCEECRDRLLEQWQEHNYLAFCPPAGEEPRPLPQDEFKELFRAAKTLFKRGIAEEELIIPTLVFANRASALPRLKAIRDEFSRIQDTDTLREQFSTDFYQRFKGLTPVTLSDEVLILRWLPIFLNAVKYSETTVVKEIVIDVFMRSVDPEQVAEHYRRWLNEQGLTYDKSSRGTFSWMFSNAHLAMTVGPGKELNEGQVSRLFSSGRQLMFPPPQLVGDLYSGLKGSVNPRRFRGFAYALGGRQSGPATSPANLIPACVAWYLREQGGISDKHRLARLLNQHLLKPCRKREIGVTSDNPVWKNIDKVADSIKRVELALQESWEPHQTSVSETHT
jgi:hypothetical protein